MSDGVIAVLVSGGILFFITMCALNPSWILPTMIILGFVIWGLIWGAICKSVVKSKGYYDLYNNGFWWGFWLGFIGLIVCAAKPAYSRINNSGETVTNNSRQTEDWRCFCGAINKEYETHCHRCNRTIKESQIKIKEMNDNESKEKNNSISAGKAKEELNTYKSMLDEGLITEEEYEAKKKQILNI